MSFILIFDYKGNNKITKVITSSEAAVVATTERAIPLESPPTSTAITNIVTAAGIAALAIDFHPLGCQLQCVHRADAQAVTRADASHIVPHQLRPGGDPLRIVTPGAAQWTALEKDSGPYARTVLRAEALDVECGTL